MSGIEPLDAENLDAWLSIGRVAKKFGWARRTMFDRLTEIDRACGGRLLKNASRGEKPYYLTTLRLIRTYDPAMYSELESFGPRITDLESQVFQLQEAVLRLGQRTLELEQIVRSRR